MRKAWLWGIAAFAAPLLIVGALLAQQVPTAPALLPGGVHFNNSVTLGDGQTSAILLDTNGSLRVNVVTGGSAGGGTSSTFGAAFPATGTAAGYASSTGTMTTGQLDASGNLKTNCTVGCSGAGATYNAAFPASGTAAGFNSSTGTLTTGQLDASGNLKVTVATGASVLQNGPWTVTQATGASVLQNGNWTVNQTTGSALSLGTATSTAPTYTSGNNAALSLDTAGNLRVNVAGGTAIGASFNGALPSVGTAAGFQTTTGTMSAGGLDASGNLKTTIATGASVLQNGNWTISQSTGSALAIATATAVAPTYVQATNNALSMDTAGNLRIASGVAAATSTSGITGAPIMGFATLAQPVYSTSTVNGVSLDTSGNMRVALQGATSGGGSSFRILSGASTNANLIKNGPGVFYGFTAGGSAGGPYFLKFYDKATVPTCNSDTVKMTYITPTQTGGALQLNVHVPTGVDFTNGISMCLTGAVADNDNTNTVANVPVVVFYK